MIKKILAVGIPSNTIDIIWDFIDRIWNDLIGALLTAFIGGLWSIFLAVFVDLSALWSFALVMFVWCYMFYLKFIEPGR